MAGQVAKCGMHKHALLLAGLVASFLPLAVRGDETITQDELVRRTQELFDAVVPANPEPWKKYYADDCLFADEKGRQLDKTKLVADITPLPQGYSGTIKLVKPVSRIIGDTAILSYDLDETETVFGQHLTARYHGTDTWLRRNGTWQIVASQAMRYYEDPAIGRAVPAKFPEFSGVYQLADGPTSLPKMEVSLSSATANASNFIPSRPTSFFAKESKAASFSAPITTARSMP
jgi:hypothetical protein